MITTEKEAIKWLHSRLKFGSRPGLERVKALLALLDHPEEKLPTIHIAGTNGKGSTVSYLRVMLEELGLTVGTFTSPFIEVFNERIAIDGQFISATDLVAWVNQIKPLVAQLDDQESLKGITEFETITALALDYFVAKEVDVAIIEVGLGGLLDSTNVVQPMLTGITSIGLDHLDILGATLEEIAAQKAGIIKAGIPLVTGKIATEALAVIDETAKKAAAPRYSFQEDYQIEYLHPAETWGEVFNFGNAHGKINQLTTPLIGQHQPENAGVAIQLFQLYCQLKNIPFQAKDVSRGLKKTTWPARMERVSQEPFIILDGAHNEHAMKRLVETMKQEFSEYQIHILFSALETKDISGMIKSLLTIPNAQLQVTTFDYPNALNLKKHDILNDARITSVSLWQVGIAEILENMSEDSLLLVTGSLYFVSEVRQLMIEMGE
ncbi:MAG: bifunctional folylpolyglutamate synthase/dihydrofolate synthase [Enterococcus sp.]